MNGTDANPFFFGTIYDLEVDMTSQFPITASLTLQNYDHNLRNHEGKRDSSQTTPRKSSKLISQRNKSSSLAFGSTTPKVHQINILPPSNSNHNIMTVREIMKQSQTPISMSRLAQIDDSNDNLIRTFSTRSLRVSRSQRSTRNNQDDVKCKTYVFGFRNEASYIPRSFIPSHKPKSLPEKPKTTRMQPPVRDHIEPHIRLSSKREINLKPMTPVCHSVILGDFDEN